MELSEACGILEKAAGMLREYQEGERGRVKVMYEDRECRVFRIGQGQVAVYRNGEIFVRGGEGRKEGRKVRRTFREEYDDAMVKKSPFYEIGGDTRVTTPAVESVKVSPRNMNGIWLFGTKEDLEATHGLDTLMSTLKDV